MSDYDVVIVGGGPVGFAAAIALGLRGRRCLVVERRETPSPIPRGQNLTQRTMEHFHFWGIEQALRAARTIPPDYGIGGMTSYGTLLGEHRYDWMKRELVRPFYFTDNERLPQYATEAVLRARAADLPGIETLFGWMATDLSQDGDGVTVGIRSQDGETRTVRGSYVIGADGSRSLVREKAGISETRSDHDRLMALLVFRSPALHGLLQRFPGKSFYCVLHPELKGYWRFLGRVDLGSTFFFHAPIPLGTTRETLDAAGLLRAAVGEDVPFELQHVGFWDLRIAMADAYQAGRIFIAGDAAHSHPPYGGYGINTGFEDAVNCAWKLDAALAGWAGPGLLESYGAERRPVFASTARDFIEAAIASDRDFLAAHDPVRDPDGFAAAWGARASGAVGEVHAFEPHYEGSPIVFGPPGGESSAKGAHRHEARPGHHLSPHRLPDGRGVPQSLGHGFTLLTFDADQALVERFTSEAERLGVPLAIVTGPREGCPYGASAVLVRPDQFVAWAGEAGDPATILRRAVGW